MRGHDEQTHHMFSYLSPEQRVPADHPLRAVRALTDHALKTMSRIVRGSVTTRATPPRPTSRGRDQNGGLEGYVFMTTCVCCTRCEAAARNLPLRCRVY